MVRFAKSMVSKTTSADAGKIYQVSQLFSKIKGSGSWARSSVVFWSERQDFGLFHPSWWTQFDRFLTVFKALDLLRLCLFTQDWSADDADFD